MKILKKKTETKQLPNYKAITATSMDFDKVLLFFLILSDIFKDTNISLSRSPKLTQEAVQLTTIKIAKRLFQHRGINPCTDFVNICLSNYFLLQSMFGNPQDIRLIQYRHWTEKCLPKINPIEV